MKKFAAVTAAVFALTLTACTPATITRVADSVPVQAPSSAVQAPISVPSTTPAPPVDSVTVTTAPAPVQAPVPAPAPVQAAVEAPAPAKHVKAPAPAKVAVQAPAPAVAPYSGNPIVDCAAQGLVRAEDYSCVAPSFYAPVKGFTPTAPVVIPPHAEPAPVRGKLCVDKLTIVGPPAPNECVAR